MQKELNLKENDFIIKDISTYNKNTLKKIKNDNFKEFLNCIKKDNVVLFHFGRYFDFEIDDIKKNGLNLPNNKLMKSRVEKAYLNKYINEDIYKQLKSINFYMDTNKDDENYIYVVTYNPNKEICFNDLRNLMNDYGGEQFYGTIERQCSNNAIEIKEYLAKKSKPCLSVIKVNFNKFLKIIDENIDENNFAKKIYNKYKNIDKSDNFILGNRLKEPIDVDEVFIFDDEELNCLSKKGEFFKINK